MSKMKPISMLTLLAVLVLAATPLSAADIQRDGSDEKRTG
jgi:hypothetical protein